MNKTSLFDKPGSYYVFNLGCPKNLVDSEVMATRLEEAGWREAPSPETASLLVVTTCAFIEPAEEESVDEILRIAAAKDDRQRLVVAGCLVSREGEALAESLPEVDLFVDVAGMVHLPRRLVAGGIRRVEARRTGASRKLFTPHHTAYLKIAEGCSNHCSYCTIPSIRGELESLDAPGIVREAACLVDSGVRELAVVAQDTGAWGCDIEAGGDIYGLLEEIARVAGDAWIRIMYLHPGHADAGKLARIMNDGLAIRYLDLPIQHASDRVLERMGRGYRSGDLERLLDRLRTGIDGLVLRTTVMVGFPGETKEDFRRLARCIERFEFDHVGIFVYSAENGTAAATLGDRVPADEGRERRDELIDIQMDISQKRLQRLVDKTELFLVDECIPPSDRPAPDVWGIGRFYGQAYEIDGVTYLSGERSRPGSFVKAHVFEAQPYDLFARSTRDFD